jgi:hypothetical protein
MMARMAQRMLMWIKSSSIAHRFERAGHNLIYS